MATCPNWPELAQGQTSTNVKALQYLLVYHGANISTDGIFGSGTKAAVVNFQSSKGLAADGIAGKNTLTKLITTVSVRTQNKAAWAAQTLLAKFEPLTVDGDFYTGSLVATRNFQETMKIYEPEAYDEPGYGAVDAITWQYLFGYDTYPSSGGGDYITAGVGGWLKLYKQPTSTKSGRTVAIPSVASTTGPDGYTYSFTNKNYWYAYENPYGSERINHWAIACIKAKTGKNPVINVGPNGEYTDENGNYWMAVGPKVPYPAQSSGATVVAENMYGYGKLDVVVKDSSGTRYYIPGVIGDIKNHTWSNGVIQTFKAYPNGAFTSAGRNFNGTVCAEFIGNLKDKFTGLGNYSVEKIIFYAD